MREALFIKKNKEKWEKIVAAQYENADELADQFTQLVDDLGYAKTFYPHSKITAYLNSEASRRYLTIYRSRNDKHNKLVHFFKYDLPLTIAKHHLVLLMCFLLFMIFFFVGFYSAAYDPLFVREMLGDGYVRMTEKNIADGKPFGVYANSNSFFMWLGILINNISVSFRFFAEGIFLCVFTLKDLITEAIRIGAFEQMFFAKGLGTLSILTVFIHGTLELSAIIIAAMAGVVMGKSWMFPGTIKRIDALKQGAKDGVKIIAGLVPVFIIAAFFEGFITRYYTMPVVLSVSILLASLIFVIGYFVVYPIRLKRKLLSVSSYVE